MGKRADILVPAIPIKKMRTRKKTNSMMFCYGLNLGGSRVSPRPMPDHGKKPTCLKIQIHS